MKQLALAAALGLLIMPGLACETMAQSSIAQSSAASSDQFALDQAAIDRPPVDQPIVADPAPSSAAPSAAKPSAAKPSKPSRAARQAANAQTASSQGASISDTQAGELPTINVPRAARTGAGASEAVSARTPAAGPYYVDFRARTAESYGHAFIWYGKSTERAIEVAGLHPASDNPLPYILGHVAPVPSETGASYGDLDEQYLTAQYRVYLRAQDAPKVFAFIKHMQANTPFWNAPTTNCTWFIGRIADFMGLKVPWHIMLPEDFVNEMRRMNNNRQLADLKNSSASN